VGDGVAVEGGPAPRTKGFHWYIQSYTPSGRTDRPIADRYRVAIHRAEAAVWATSLALMGSGFEVSSTSFEFTCASLSLSRIDRNLSPRYQPSSLVESLTV
jgi:hypothetical protein